jgi:hypothetical protein
MPSAHTEWWHGGAMKHSKVYISDCWGAKYRWEGDVGVITMAVNILNTSTGVEVILFGIIGMYIHSFIHSFITHSINPYKGGKPIGYRICYDTNIMRTK